VLDPRLLGVAGLGEHQSAAHAGDHHVVAHVAADLRCRPRHDPDAARLRIREDFCNPVAVSLAVADDLATHRQATRADVVLDVERQ
jgi:hypothetical protein